jgi:hypothetical protein
MATIAVRVSWPDLVWLAGVVVIGGLLALCLSAGWAIAVVPGATYLVAGTAALAVYRIATRRRAELGLPASYRVVDAKGTCLLGRQVGDVISIGAAGNITPHLCPHAEAALRLASTETEEATSEWCCPVYDHLLVFQREALAA